MEEPTDLAQIRHPRIGYSGYIKKQLDWPMLLALTSRHPDWSFVFLGNISAHPEILPAIRELSGRRNVYFLGSKTVHELAAYPQHFDVCIMPYRQDAYTKYIYPMKLHEYLASGRPAVGTRIRSLAEFNDVVTLACTPEEWSAAITNSLSAEANSPEHRAARQKVAQQNDWHGLVLQIARVKAERLGPDYSRRLFHLLLTRKRSIDMVAHGDSPREQERIANLLDTIPKGYSSILDVGGRDGHISSLLTENFDSVTCLDLKKPQVANEKVFTVQGDATHLDYPDNQFDVVLCAEVLEHILPDLLPRACGEIGRVAKYAVIVGVPYKQDCRLGRTTCQFCGKTNPPWGHSNVFDETRLK